jgi:hypothetical protein
MPQLAVGACHGGRDAPIDAYDMSQWKGYGPDNVLPADAAALTTASFSRQRRRLDLRAVLRPEGEAVQPVHRSAHRSTRSPIHTAVSTTCSEAIPPARGIIVLTGDMGTGKTTLCRAALYQLDRKTFHGLRSRSVPLA